MTPAAHPPYLSFPGHRIFNTHLWWEMMPKQGAACFIYVVRSARDVCASFYHHLSHQAPADGGYKGSLDEFVADWVGGRIAFGSWPEHVSSWLDPEAAELAAAARDERVLVLSYEQMKTDVEGVTRQVAAHIGVEVSEEQLAVIVPRLDVSYMKANNEKFVPKSVEWIDKGKHERSLFQLLLCGPEAIRCAAVDPAVLRAGDGFQFVRAGKVGGGKALFDERHEEQFKALFASAPLPKCVAPFV